MNIATHPIQRHNCPRELRTEVTLRAYEVYVHLYGKQEALVTGGCRGGFGVGEVIAFLYARSFPKAEWDARFHEALKGMRTQA